MIITLSLIFHINSSPGRQPTKMRKWASCWLTRWLYATMTREWSAAASDSAAGAARQAGRSSCAVSCLGAMDSGWLIGRMCEWWRGGWLLLCLVWPPEDRGEGWWELRVLLHRWIWLSWWLRKGIWQWLVSGVREVGLLSEWLFLHSHYFSICEDVCRDHPPLPLQK